MTAIEVDDPWMMTADGGGDAPTVKDGPINWVAVKSEILGKLNVIAEYRALGVRFVRDAFNAKGWAECHAIERPDEHPSAAVNTRGLYVDRGAGGSQMDLIDFAVKYGPYGQWTEALKHYAGVAGVEVGRIAKKSGGRIHETTYLYRDGSGEVRYGVFRYRTEKGGKTFTQHPPDGKGGWKHGPGCMDGVEPLPYRIPELLASADSGETVWIVEGEKDAERLADLGLVVTTGHGGAANAAKSWGVFDLAPFVGRDLVVLPDHDPAGRQYAETAARLLVGHARTVKIVSLPDLPAKGDVSDWLDLGHTVEELGRLAHAAPEFDPATPVIEVEESPETRDATVADLRLKLSNDAWLWTGWVANNVLCLLAAEAGHGKTRFYMDLIRRIYNGLPWPDGTPPPIFTTDPRFLILASDNNHGQFCEIAEQYGIPDEALVMNAFASDPFAGTSLQTADELLDFEARITRVKPVFAVIDTITNSSDLKTQDSSDAKKQYKPLQEIAARQRIPIFCVTHLNAGGKVLGRRAIEKARTVIQIETPDPEGQPDRRKLWVSKSYALKPDALGITMGVNGNEYDFSPPEPPSEGQRIDGAGRGPIPAKTRECMDWLTRRLSHGPARVSAIRTEAEAADFSSTVLYRAKKEIGAEESLEDNRKWWALIVPTHANGDGEEVAF